MVAPTMGNYLLHEAPQPPSLPVYILAKATFHQVFPSLLDSVSCGALCLLPFSLFKIPSCSCLLWFFVRVVAIFLCSAVLGPLSGGKVDEKALNK